MALVIASLALKSRSTDRGRINWSW